ncbi:MAG: LysR family transcriptional regulator [Chthoniobacterales bacterium]|jgi:DNA-binding transcriptional LysR family regulator
MSLLSKGGLSLERLQALLDFAEAGSLIKAARADPVRQSLLSRQIRELGEFFGTELVARRGRGIVLTESGRGLVALVRDGFQSMEDFRLACAGSPVRLSLAASRTIINHVVIPQLRPSLVPGAAIDLFQERSADLVPAVAASRFDFCVVDHSPLPRGLASRPLGRLTYSLYVPRVLAAAKRLTIDQALRQLPAALPAAGRIREHLQPLLADNIDAVVGLPGFDACLALLRTDRYAAALPDVAMAAEGGRKYIRLPLDKVGLKPRQYSLVWSKRSSANRTAVAKAVEIFSRCFAFAV